MSINSEEILDNIYLSYNKVLKKLNLLKLKTKTGQNIKATDLRYAIYLMNKLHYLCRWKVKREKGEKGYILIEGYYWLRYVYFQNKKKLIDADIEFFISRIKQYQELLNLQPKEIFNKNMYVSDLPNYFNKSYETVKKAIIKMNNNNSTYRYKKCKKNIISNKGIEWLCKNCFKDKYLKELEKYKMELTDKYIEFGYIYDNYEKF